MTIIYVKEHNTKCYAVNFQNNGWTKVQKSKYISVDKNTIYCVKPLEIFVVKSKSCLITAFSGDLDKPVFDGNTFLLKISGEKDENRYLYIGGDMECSFLNNDKIYK